MSLRRRMLFTLLAFAALLVAVGAVSLHTESRLRDRIARLDPALSTVLAYDNARFGPELRALAADVGEARRLVLGTTLAAMALAFLVAVPLWRSMAERLTMSMQYVAALRAAQAGLQRSLDEKELLLREAHHRVKNNLQVVASLLDLQARASGNRLLMEEVEVSQSRIRCMALVHEQLYGAREFDQIGTSEYLKRLASHLVDCFGQPPRIRLRLDLEDLPLDVDRATTVGLLTNELLSNSLKHAFPADRSGEVRLMLASQEDACVLTVADDGVGMWPQPEKAGCLGLSLVTTLARQLHGSVSFECIRGTSVRIEFPMENTLEQKAAS